jgi:hypothetical protein
MRTALVVGISLAQTHLCSVLWFFGPQGIGGIGYSREHSNLTAGFDSVDCGSYYYHVASISGLTSDQVLESVHVQSQLPASWQGYVIVITDAARDRFAEAWGQHSWLHMLKRLAPTALRL